MSQYTIIRNAPPPDRTVKYPWGQLEVNDEFIVPIALDRIKGRCIERMRLGSAASQINKRGAAKYQVYQTPGFVHCRRTA